MVYLGTLSYGIFLWHLFVLESASYLLRIPGFSGWFWLLWPITVIGTVGCAHISYVLIERPAQEFSHSQRRIPWPWTTRQASPPPTPQPEHSPAARSPQTRA